MHAMRDVLGHCAVTTEFSEDLTRVVDPPR